MANPTTNLGLTKPTSEQDASKVATLNVEADELDSALAGYLALSVAGSANVTLTRTQALNKLLKFTGALTGNISVSIPATLGNNRLYVIWNATSGAFTLSLKIGSGTAKTITQGKSAIMFHDGTDVYFGPEFTPSTGIGNFSIANASDYIEGTPTLALKFGGNSVGMTYSIQVTRYKRIGKAVFITGYLLLSAKGSSTGSATITGLPIAASSVTNHYQGFYVYLDACTFTGGGGNGFIAPGATSITLQFHNNGTNTTMTDVHFGNTSGILLNFCYFID